MEPGDAVFFHEKTLHESGGNISGQVRVAAMLQCAPTEEQIVVYQSRSDIDAAEEYEVADDFYVSEGMNWNPQISGAKRACRCETVSRTHIAEWIELFHSDL